MVNRVGRNRRIVDASGDVVSSGLSHIPPKDEPLSNTEDTMVITCKGDAPNKRAFLAHPPEEIIFRVDGYCETVCTRLEDNSEWVTYFLDITNRSIYNTLFIFKKPCEYQKHMSLQRGLPDNWQIIPNAAFRSDRFGRERRCDVTLLLFELIGFDLYEDFS
jgi:hypothetical protein